jgi:hypothetical protein
MAHELADWYEEAERLRVERDVLTAQLAERDAQIVALQAERHELCQFLIEWDGQDSFREPDYRDQLEERYLNWISRSKDVLSDAIEAAVPAPPTAAPRAAAEQRVIEAAIADRQHYGECDACEDGETCSIGAEYVARLAEAVDHLMVLRAARGEAGDTIPTDIPKTAHGNDGRS